MQGHRTGCQLGNAKTKTDRAVIRHQKKDHGVGKEIEGTLTNRIIIIDDVITSGTSIIEVVRKYIIPRFGDNFVLDIFVLVDREQHSMKNVHSLATLSEIKKWKPLKEDISSYQSY